MSTPDVHHLADDDELEEGPAKRNNSYTVD